jgi:sugar transferase (PEP-CTERM/EpsH1 system associated)
MRLGTRETLTHLLLDSPKVLPALRRIVERQPPDVVLAYCSGMGRFAMHPVLAGFPLVVDMVDVDSMKWRGLAARHGGPMGWIYRREARLLSRFESVLATHARATAVVTRREAGDLQELAPAARVLVSPIGVDADRLRPPAAPEDSQDVVFCGVMNYGPNEDAAAWMVRTVWPAVRKRKPGARLLLLGAEPSKRVRHLASKVDGVVVTGTVDDVRPYLWKAAVSIAPLMTARGTQTKVIEATACGLPSVITDVVAMGLPESVLAACTRAGSPAAFADAVVALLETPPAQRRALAERAHVSQLSWESALEPLLTAVKSAAQ